MDNKSVCGVSRNTLRTDLSLLLDCLKFQMRRPDMQKQALLAIHSICENSEDAVDILKEMGGVAFVFNLSKPGVVHSDVRMTALFTLGALAEANVYCKDSLCRKETFVQLFALLTKDTAPLTEKRVSIYLLSVLVANNKSGQTLAQISGCLDVLFDLFRTSFPLSTEAAMGKSNTTQVYQLWASVSSALCGCVNNPQNEELQRVCVAVFPMIKIWLQDISMPRTEIFQPICSFLAMTVANNTCVQESFSASGGLDTLCLALVHLASAADTSLLSCQLCVTIAKTLSACVVDNSSLASGLAQYGLVSHLFSVLMSPHLEPEDRLSILLTLSHCTEASEAHQTQLVQSGGLPLIITLLTEDTSEEVRKAATFILQTCKQATMSLGAPGLSDGENTDSLGNINSYMSSARELLHRLHLLEKRQVDKDKQKDAEPSASVGFRRARPRQGAEDENDTGLGTVEEAAKEEGARRAKGTSPRVNEKEEDAGDVTCLTCMGTGTLLPLEGARVLQPHNHFLEPLPPLSPSLREIKSMGKCKLLSFCVFYFCFREKTSEAERILAELRSVRRDRCAGVFSVFPSGCVLTFEEVTSRNFASLQSSSQSSCDMHRVLQQATERFRKQRRDILLRGGRRDHGARRTHSRCQPSPATGPQNICLTPIQSGQNKKASPTRPRTKHGFGLTPLHRGTKADASVSSRAPGLYSSACYFSDA
ncbi:telomere repeats-binding bouquet formation protein 1 [Nelusetta ayraudi]|uniref:telomere repeats-binding bouquet formation protein 1 n=1 Tax=Nelusetta ayraudi TaxID=303726 RepID=UPI003F72E862